MLMKVPPLSQALQARAREHVTSHAGCTVRWREFGAGPPLIALHGGHGTWQHWSRNVDALASRYRVWLPDMPGFGESDSLPLAAQDPARLDALVDTLAAGVHQLVGAERFHLLGFSFGGLVASLLAQRMAAQVRSLVLLGSAGHGMRRPTEVPMRNWRDFDGDERMEVLRENLCAFMLHGPVDDDALWIHARACEHTRFRSKRFSREARLGEVLRGLTMPIFMLWGEHDVTAEPVKAAEFLMQGRKEREWMVMPNAGHWVQYDSAPAVNVLLTYWLSQR